MPFADRPQSEYLVHVSGLACLVGYACLAWYSRGTFEEPQLIVFYGLLCWVTLPAVFLFALVYRDHHQLSIYSVLLWALAFRMCGLFGEPLFEDDYFRYLWDGYLFVESGTPYGFVPSHFFGEENLPTFAQQLLNGINNPNLPTIYGPTNQYLFAFSHLLQPGSLLPLQILLIGFDLLLIWLLTKVADLKYVFAYAWCPLTIKETAFSAHPDIIGVLFLFAAVVFVYRHRLILACSFLALAVGAKVFALLLAPFVLVRTNLKGWIVFLIVLTALYLPFLVHGSSDFTSLFTFAREWEFNASVYSLLSNLITPLATKVLLGLAYLSFLFYYLVKYWNSRSCSIPRGDVILGLFLLIAPVVNPWYLIWLLPFAVLYPSFWVWTSSVAVFLAYITAINLGDFNSDPFQQPTWVLVIEYGVVFVALGIDAWFKREQFRTNTPGK